MRSARKYSWFFLLVVMVFVVVSGGCGGGSGGGSTDESGGNAWDTDPPPYDVNQPDNDTGDDDTGYDDTGDTTPNPQPDNTGNSSPVAINGTWEIVSGRGIVSSVISGTTEALHYTYATGMNSKVGIEITQNGSEYYGYYKNLFSVTLTGANVIGSGTRGGGALMVYCTTDEYPDQEADLEMTFVAGMAFSYIGNGTYQMTDKSLEQPIGMNNNAVSYTYTIALENASTLRWTVSSKNNELTVGSSGERWQEIVLQKVQ